MAGPVVRNTGTVLMAVLKSEYRTEGADLDLLVGQLQRLMYDDQQMGGRVRYRPNQLGSRRQDAPSFTAYVKAQLEILELLDLVEFDGGRWKLIQQSVPPDVSGERWRHRDVPGDIDGEHFGGIAGVLAHPTLFCIPASEFEHLVAAAVGVRNG